MMNSFKVKCLFDQALNISLANKNITETQIFKAKFNQIYLFADNGKNKHQFSLLLYNKLLHNGMFNY